AATARRWSTPTATSTSTSLPASQSPASGIRIRATSRRCKHSSSAGPSAASPVRRAWRCSSCSPSWHRGRCAARSSTAAARRRWKRAFVWPNPYTKKFELVGFWGGFHGKTGGVIGLIGDQWKQHWGPLQVGTHLVPYADCYRCPLKLNYPSCGIACLDFMREQLDVTTAGEIAAVIIEPMQGTAGNVIPPPEFLPGVPAIAKERGALLIADEMITGFGRTGRMFGCEHTDTEPDVMTIGKGFGCGFP